MSDISDCDHEREGELELCAGAKAYEVMTSNTAIIHWEGVMTCSCCELCRQECLKYFHEEYPNYPHPCKQQNRIN